MGNSTRRALLAVALATAVLVALAAAPARQPAVEPATLSPTARSPAPQPAPAAVPPSDAPPSRLEASSGGDDLLWSTYIGAYLDDWCLDVAYGNAAVYLCGWTTSPQFPVTAGAFNETHSGGKDAWVARLSSDGTALDWCTFLGGEGDDVAYGIAVCDNGTAVVAGSTESTTFPTTSGAYDESYNSLTDGFVAVLSPDGASLEYSTYVGGSHAQDTEWFDSVALDQDENRIHVVGCQKNLLSATYAGYPTWEGVSYDDKSNGLYDCVYSVIKPSGGSSADLWYSTYFGGSGSDEAYDVAVDASGNAYLAGRTQGCPVTSGDVWYSGPRDAFLAVFYPGRAGQADFLYATYIGGTDGSVCTAHSVSLNGTDAWVAGTSDESDMYSPSGAYQRSNAGGQDAFLTVIDTAESGSYYLDVVYATYIGGSGDDAAYGVDFTGQGAVMVGATSSSDWPLSVDPHDSSIGNTTDAFLAVIHPNKSESSDMAYSTYIGGSQATWELANGVSCGDTGTEAYVAGTTPSADFPTTAGAFNETFGGSTDAWALRIENLTVEATPNPLITVLTHPGNRDVGQNYTVTCNITDLRGWQSVASVEVHTDYGVLAMTNTTLDLYSVTWIVNGALSQHWWSVRAVAVDGAVNSSEVHTYWAGGAPDVVSTSAPSSVKATKVVTLSAHVTDNRPGDSGVAAVSVLWRGAYRTMEEDAEVSGLFSWSGSAGDDLGEQDVRVRALDVAGNTNYSRTLHVVVLNLTSEEAVEEEEEGPPAPRESGWWMWYAMVTGGTALALLAAQFVRWGGVFGYVPLLVASLGTGAAMYVASSGYYAAQAWSEEAILLTWGVVTGWALLARALREVPVTGSGTGIGGAVAFTILLLAVALPTGAWASMPAVACYAAIASSALVAVPWRAPASLFTALALAVASALLWLAWWQEVILW